MKVNVPKPSQRPPGSPSRLLALVLLLSSRRAWAADETCSDTTTPSFFCRLHGILHLLSAVAAVLGAFLVIAIGAAIWYYRRNRDTDLTPP